MISCFMKQKTEVFQIICYTHTHSMFTEEFGLSLMFCQELSRAKTLEKQVGETVCKEDNFITI